MRRVNNTTGTREGKPKAAVSHKDVHGGSRG